MEIEIVKPTPEAKELQKLFAEGPYNWTRKQIYNLALKISKISNYFPECDIVSRFYNLGGRFHRSDTDYFTFTEDGWFSLNDRWSDDRFQIAKAIGHYFLHTTVGTPMSIRNGVVDRMEVEGNWFAARFLLPEPEFSARFKEWKSIARLSVHFDVPECAIERVINTN